MRELIFGRGTQAILAHADQWLVVVCWVGTVCLACTVPCGSERCAFGGAEYTEQSLQYIKTLVSQQTPLSMYSAGRPLNTLRVYSVASSRVHRAALCIRRPSPCLWQDFESQIGAFDRETVYSGILCVFCGNVPYIQRKPTIN